MDNIWVHIDLKGMVPEPHALQASLRRFAQWGVNGFLFEIEDMYPFKAAKQSVREDCYSQQEWQEIIDVCNSLEAEFVPLIQTLGHLEWLLWHEDFAHLRLVDEANKAVSGAHTIYQMQPCSGEGIELINSLINEIIEFHGNLNYIHIGGDETFFIGDDPGEDYLEHMLPIIGNVITQDVTPMIWSDMVLAYFEILEKIPEQTIFVDWIYSHRSRTGTNPSIRGAGRDSKELEPRFKEEFEEHIIKGQGHEGNEKNLYPYPSYFNTKGRPFFIVPAAQSSRDPFTHPTLFWKFDNARSYCMEGECNRAKGAINSDWIVRRNMRELTRICHFGFAANCCRAGESLDNREIIRKYWEDISPGSGDRAVEVFEDIGEVRGFFFNESRPLGHNPGSNHWHVDTISEKMEKAPYEPGELDEDDELVVLNRKLIKIGRRISEFCGMIIPGVEPGEKKAEVECWRLSGLEISLRAQTFLFIRKAGRNEASTTDITSLVNQAEKVEEEFRRVWTGRYRKADIEIEMEWRFKDIVRYAQKF